MYQLSESDLKVIAAWFHGDVPCKNGVSLFDVIATLSDAKNAPVAQTATVEAPAEAEVVEAPVEIAE